jgi:N-acetylmuramoyl-L-alanine amidase
MAAQSAHKPTRQKKGLRALCRAPQLTLPAMTVQLAMTAFLTMTAFSSQLSPLAHPPDWSRLDRFQETITHDEFEHLLTAIYAPSGAGDQWIVVQPNQAVIQESEGHQFILRFAADDSSRKPVPRYWTPIDHLRHSPSKPLKGITIAIDPGHLGGKWAKMEERWFRIGDSKPVTEGDMTLKVALLLVPRLKALGANVALVRFKPGPVTQKRPNELLDQAKASLAEHGVTTLLPDYSGPDDPQKENSIPWEAERLFYRVAEIRARANIVNLSIKPDVTLCLHMNAEPWGDPAHPTLVQANHLHLITNGTYSKEELANEDVRFAMLVKLLNQVYPEELALSETIAAQLAKVTHLPPYTYTTANAKSLGTSGYVWARNLIANRLYDCPVVYIESYVMNNEEVFARIQAGEYAGHRNFGGVMRKNIYTEYADGIVNGLVAYATSARTENRKPKTDN